MEFWIKDYQFENYKEFFKSVGIDTDSIFKVEEEETTGYHLTQQPLYKYIPAKNDDGSFVVMFDEDGAKTPKIKIPNEFVIEEYMKKSYSKVIPLTEQKVLEQQKIPGHHGTSNTHMYLAWRIKTSYKLTLEDLQKILTEKYVEISMDEGLYTLSIPSLDNE